MAGLDPAIHGPWFPRFPENRTRMPATRTGMAAREA